MDEENRRQICTCCHSAGGTREITRTVCRRRRRRRRRERRRREDEDEKEKEKEKEKRRRREVHQNIDNSPIKIIAT
jgi:hypothetical protein